MATSSMSRLRILIGTWNTAGEVLETAAGPASTLMASDTYRWLPGEHFVVHEADARFGSTVSRSMEVLGYDAATRQYWSTSYDDRGKSERFQLALQGRSWQIDGDSARFRGQFSLDMSELSGLWELREPDGHWQPWIKLKLVRA